MGLLIGTSGYVYRDWRGLFYPEGLPARLWLEHYCGAFETLELNATFYRLPSLEAARHWKEVSPRSFRFAAKGSRYLTHMKRLTDVERGLTRFYERAAGLGRKLAVVLWQLPPQMKRPDLERLDRFLAAQPARYRHAVEFRSALWYTEPVCRLLDGHGAALCEHDLLPPPPRPTGGWRYLRFHGATGKYEGRYGPRALRPVARDLKRWAAGGRDAYVYFNNDRGGAAIKDALALKRMTFADG